MVKVVRYLPKSEAAVHWWLQPLTEKRLFRVSFLRQLQVYSLKKRLRRRCFPVSLPNITEHFFFDDCEQLFLAALEIEFIYC